MGQPWESGLQLELEQPTITGEKPEGKEDCTIPLMPRLQYLGYMYLGEETELSS